MLPSYFMSSRDLQKNISYALSHVKLNDYFCYIIWYIRNEILYLDYLLTLCFWRWTTLKRPFIFSNFESKISSGKSISSMFTCQKLSMNFIYLLIDDKLAAVDALWNEVFFSITWILVSFLYSVEQGRPPRHSRSRVAFSGLF